MTEKKMVNKYRELCRYSVYRLMFEVTTSNEGVSCSNSSNLIIESSISSHMHESLNCEIVLGTGEDTKCYPTC